MANPVSIVQAIIDLALKIKKEVETFRHNREDCRKIGELVATVRAVAEGLRKTTEAEDGGGGGAALVGGALKALKQALERAWDLVVACQRKNAVRRTLNADAIAEKLRRVYLDVSLNLSAVVLANGAYNTSKLADITGIVAALRADVANNTRMLAKIMEIVAALPDAHLQLRQQVARLVQSYSDSTDDDATYYYQNESASETKKTETEKTEIKKTDVVARYSTYSASNAYPVTGLVQSYSDSTDDDSIYYQNQCTSLAKIAETMKTESKKVDNLARYSTYSSSYAYPSYFDYTAPPGSSGGLTSLYQGSSYQPSLYKGSSYQPSLYKGHYQYSTSSLYNGNQYSTSSPWDTDDE